MRRIQSNLIRRFSRATKAPAHIARASVSTWLMTVKRSTILPLMSREPVEAVIVLTDGEPSDIDVADPLDLVEDARRAAVGLRARGIDGFGVVLGSGAMTSAARIFGRGNTMLVPRIEDLPARLSELYFRLARR